ncbi:MAG: NUDIX hydrolase [Firmicutes bacterium]|nr:NUDIX hydrolase [Bacillota bacterium]
MSFKWFDGEVPSDIVVRQVSGLVFDKYGRMLLRNAFAEGYNLGGGRPEPTDTDMEATLRREMLEELNVTIGKPVLVGYQTYEEKGQTFAQVRMTAIIDEIRELRPDPDTNITWGRLLTHPEKAIKLLNWGETGALKIRAAVKVAKEKLGLKNFLDKDQVV